MSLLKKIGIGTGIGVVVLGLGYFGYKKIRGKKEEDVIEVVEETKDNIKKYYDDLVDRCKLSKEEVDELANQHFNKK